MFKKLTDKTAKKLVENKVIKKEEFDIYRYCYRRICYVYEK